MENIKMTECGEVKLKDICKKIYSGGTPKSSETVYYGGNIPWLNTKEVHFNRIYRTEQNISELGFKNSSAKFVPENNVIIAMYGATAGNVAVNKIPLTTNQACCNLIINDSIASYEYVYYSLLINHSNLASLANGGAQQNLNSKQIREFAIPLPPLDVQKRIAGILGALDDRIDVLRRENVVLEQMAQAVFQSWFVDFDIVRAKAAGTPESEVCEKYHISPELYALFPSALTPDNLPLGWEKKKLGDLAFNASETHTAQDVEKLIFINTSDVKNGVFLHNKYSVRSEMPGQAKKSIKENDILYSEIRPINKHFAFVNFDSKDYIVSTKFMIIRSFDINNVFYIYFFLTLKETLNSFQALAENRSGTFPQITFESISKTEIVFSNRELHWYFSDYLKKTYTKIFENEKQIRTLEQTRDALLPKLMNGEIEV